MHVISDYVSCPFRLSATRKRPSMNSAISDAFDVVNPNPGALIESLRSFGYSLETSIADIVDNSITAGAHNIHIQFSWHGEQSTIAIMDDGCGMTEDDLVNAMRPGSRNPLEDRDPADLGRFGLGLKTASFSQCRNSLSDRKPLDMNRLSGSGISIM